MKKFRSKLKRTLVMPLLGGICAASLLGGIAALDVSPRANAEGTATESEVSTPAALPTGCNIAKGATVYGPEDQLGEKTSISSLVDGQKPGGWQYGMNPGKAYEGDYVRYVQYKHEWGIGDYDSEHDVYAGWIVHFVIDLGETKSWNSVKVHGLVESGSGINVPYHVLAYSLESATDFNGCWSDEVAQSRWNSPLAELSGEASDTDYELSGSFEAVKSRYVAVVIVSHGHFSIDEIEVSGEHDLEEVAEVPPTTSEYGVKEHYKCKACGKKYLLQGNEYVEASDDDLRIDKLVYVVPDDCNIAKGATVYGPEDQLGEKTSISSLVDGQKPGGWQYGMNPGKAYEGDYVRYVQYKHEWGIGDYDSEHDVYAGWIVHFVIDLGETKSWNSVKVHGLVESGSGINVPYHVLAYSLESATDFNGCWSDEVTKSRWNSPLAELSGEASDTDYELSGSFEAVKSRYVAVVIVSHGHFSIDEIEVSGEHDLEKVAEVPPTTSEYGVKAHYACKDCGATYLLNEAEYKYVAASEADLRLERTTGFFALQGASMTLNNNFDVHFKAHVAGEPNSVVAKVTLNGVETEVNGVSSGDGDYVFTFKKLGPQNLGKELTLKLYVDGVESGERTFKATDYLESVFNCGDEEQQRMIADAFAYAAAAQAYLGYEGELITDVYPQIKAKATTFIAPTLTDKKAERNNTVDGYTFTEANLRISSEMKIVFKFKASGAYTLKVNDKDVSGQVANKNGVYEYCTNGISVVEFGKVYKAELYAGDTLVQTVEYSVNSYVYSMNASSNEKLANLVKCIYNYGLSATDATPVDRTQQRANAAKYTTLCSNATEAKHSADLTDGVTVLDTRTASVNAYSAYTAGSQIEVILDLGKKVSGLAAFELYAYQGALTQQGATYNGVLPSAVTVYVSDDNNNWTAVGVCYATTKAQTYFCYEIELPYAVDGRYVKYQAASAGSASDYYLISEVCAYVYSNEFEENNVYSGGAEISKVTEEVYGGSTSKSTNLISGKLAKIDAEGIVEQGYAIEPVEGTDSEGNKVMVSTMMSYVYNTPASKSGILTDGEEVSGVLGYWLDEKLAFKSYDKYFKFYGYGYRRISYDLGSICDVESVTFRAFRHDSSYCAVPSTVYIYLSIDGETWYDASSITYSSTTDKRLNEQSLTVGKQARFVAFEFEVSTWCAIDELEVTGKTLKDASAGSYERIDTNGTVKKETEDKGIPSAEGYAKDVYLAYHSLGNDGGWGPMTQDECEKVVAYTDADGKMQGTMFDGALFLTNGSLYNGPRDENSMTYYMTADSLVHLRDSLYCTGDDYAENNYNVKALCNAVQKMKDQGVVGDDYKVKVYFTLYYPKGVTDGGDFGTYTVGNESVSDISSTTSIAKLLELWIKDMESKFTFGDNLEIGGYYWYAESMENSDQATVAKSISEYLDSINRKFIWIPYFDSNGIGDWEANGFDIAVLQPNYAFDMYVQSTRLDTAAMMANRYGTAIEFEMDTRALTDENYRVRYYDYLARAKDLGYADTVHFYYLGARISDWLADASGVGREIYDVTYDFIADGEISKPQSVATVRVDAQKGKTTDITLLENASSSTKILLREPPKHGSVTINADGTVTYHAEEDYTGTVTFTYAYAIAGVYSDACTVVINVSKE